MKIDIDNAQHDSVKIELSPAREHDFRGSQRCEILIISWTALLQNSTEKVINCMSHISSICDLFWDPLGTPKPVWGSRGTLKIDMEASLEKKTDYRRPKSPPREATFWPKGVPKGSPRGPQGVPRGPKGSPRGPQGVPKESQGVPKGPRRPGAPQ